jgi:hypothetical protein
MTEQMAKECIQGKLDCMNTCDVFDCKNTDECDSCNYCYSQGNFGEQKKAFEIAIQALTEIQQYRAIGTVEELQALKEKSVAKKPFQPFGTHSYKCPSCWKFVAHEVDDNCDLKAEMAEWCPFCSQHLDWE